IRGDSRWGINEFDNDGVVDVRMNAMTLAGTVGTNTGYFTVDDIASVTFGAGSSLTFNPLLYNTNGYMLQGDGLYLVSSGVIDMAQGATVEADRVRLELGAITGLGTFSARSLGI